MVRFLAKEGGFHYGLVRRINSTKKRGVKDYRVQGFEPLNFNKTTLSARYRGQTHTVTPDRIHAIRKRGGKFEEI